MCGDVKATLTDMLAQAGGPTPRAEWLEQCRGYVADYWAESDPLRDSGDVPIRPERMAKELGEWMPSNAVLVVDTFHAALWTAQMTKMKAGQRYIRCGGSLGWGFPGTLGVKAALAGTPVIGFTGDAGFYYHMAEMETAARCGINAVMVVNNNFSGGVAETAAFQKEVNLTSVANSMGCAGFRVEKPSDIRNALDKALACGKPAIVEIIGDASIRAKRAWAPAGVTGE